jgi:glycosyltransferase involved in cell wall biosynthesis
MELNSVKRLGNERMESLSVSVIIPAYNEEESIERVLLRTHNALESMGLPYEVILVDDGSTDRTRFLAERQKATILSNGSNRGKGHAVKRGLNSALGDVIVLMDADGSHQPEEIPKLIKPLMNGADIVAGSRFLGIREEDSVKKLHVFGNYLINFLILLLTKKRITDSQSGFRAYKKKVFEEISLTSEGYSIETELTVKTLKNGFVFQEEPIMCEKRRNGSSKLNTVSDGFKIFKTILLTYVFS